MTLDFNGAIRDSLERYGTYMSLDQLGERWHTAPATVGKAIKDGHGPGVAIFAEDGLRTKFIIPTISVLIFEVNAGLPEEKKLDMAKCLE